MTRMGQCQRYIEYDSLPIHWNGGRRRRDSAPRVGAVTPPAMIRAAPTTGSATADPGYGVLAVNSRADTTIAARPAQVMIEPKRRGMRRSHWVLTATSAPRASSHARVNGEK